MKQVITFANEILEMQERIHFLEYQVERLGHYKTKYEELLAESHAHNTSMVSNLFVLGMEMAELRNREAA